MAHLATVQVFGSLKVEVSGAPVSFKTRPVELLLGRLLIEPLQRIPRSTLLEDIWPDVLLPSSANRLRTTLVLLKHTLAPWQPIESGRSHVSVTDEGTHFDLVEAQNLLRKARLLWDREEEEDSLQRLLGLINSDLLAGWDFDWLARPRETWRNHRLDSLLRLTQLAIDRADPDEVLRLADATLAVAPYHSVAWGHYLRTMAKQGMGTVAVDRFRETRKKLREEGDDFPAEVTALARHVHGGGIKPEVRKRDLTTPELEIVTNTFERAFVSDPSLLLAAIASPAFRVEVFRRPHEAFRFATSVLDNSRQDDPNRIKAMWAVLAAGLTINDHERTISICEWLIDHTDESSQDHRLATMQMGFMHFERRNWEEAHRWTDRLIALTDKYGNASDKAVCQVHVASLDWQEGHYDRAELGYLEAITQFEAMETIRDVYNYSAIQLNLGFVRLMQRDFDGCEAWVLKASRLASAQGVETVRIFALPLLGLCRAVRGDRQEGHKLIVEGITMTYRNRAIRFHEIGMDFAAAALALAGHASEATGLLDAYARFRAERSHGRSVAETSFENWIREQADGADPSPAWANEPDIRVLIERTCTLLEA